MGRLKKIRKDAFAWRQTLKFSEMILKDRCSTSYGLASLLHGKRNALGFR